MTQAIPQQIPWKNIKYVKNTKFDFNLLPREKYSDLSVSL